MNRFLVLFNFDIMKYILSLYGYLYSIYKNNYYFKIEDHKVR